MKASEVSGSIEAAGGHASPDAGNGADGVHTGGEDVGESASLLAELRVQREANVALLLEVNARRTAAELAVRREEVLLGQLELERSLRRRAEEDLRESQALGSSLQHQIGLANAVAASAQQEVRETAAKLGAAQARATALLVKLSEAEARHNALEAEVNSATARADDAVNNQRHLGDLLALSEARADESSDTLLQADRLIRRLASGLRRVAGHLAEILGALTTASGSHVSAVGESEVSTEEMTAILVGLEQLHSERQAAALALAEAGRDALAWAARLEAVYLANQELLAEVEAERSLSAAQAVQLERLGRTVSEQEEIARGLQALLAQRDAALAGLSADHAAASARLQQLEADAKSLTAQLTQANSDILTGREKFSRRQTELQVELDRARKDASASASKVAKAERENETLVQAQRKLEQEAREMTALLEDRRQVIRKLQQEMALLKLGRA
jgi:chromosome segregation ATPase